MVIRALVTLFIIVSASTAIPCMDAQPIKGVLSSMDEFNNVIRNRSLCRVDGLMRNIFSNETMLKMAIVLLTLAFLCYSTGVTLEVITGLLKPWYVKLFWLGFLFEASGATLMFTLGRGEFYPIHMIIGGVALTLIVTHNILASLIVRMGVESLLKGFPRFSFLVYIIWLIAFITGMIIGITQPSYKTRVV